jgi:alkanesulfonate monooxygenase SsuD/methylene tetrahydromethanopterin reductase-like flavin-dependent oxidoreductase (luciferase family)
MDRMPAISLAAVPGRRLRTLELVAEIERRGFSGIYGPSLSDVMSLCLSIAHLSERVVFGPTIQPIYARRAHDLAQTASYIAEVSEGRFVLGLGVSHGPAHRRMGAEVGKPLSDMRAYVTELRSAIGERAPAPPIVLASLRTKMIRLAVEIADGSVWANGARSHMGTSLAEIPTERREAGFFVGNMIPTVIDDDREAAAAVNRRTLAGYVALPNYRNYWREAGYEEEMDAIERALDAGERDRVPELMTDRWLSDVTLYGSAAEVREGVEAWFEAGVDTPILVPSATSGGQMQAIQNLFEAFAR